MVVVPELLPPDAAALRLLELVLTPLLERFEEVFPEVLALERLLELLERLVETLERLEELLERLVEALERLELPELLMVPPTALDVELDDDERLLLTEELPRDELEDEDERLLLTEELPRDEDEDDDDDERDEDVWLEDERLLLPPLLDWALTVQGASAIATAAAAESASLKNVFIMLNFSVRKYKYSI